MRQIDLNCDMGESFGAWTMGQDETVMPLVSSANIACGFHAGDPSVMRRSVRLARTHGVAIGAHVGLPDLQGFGRREMHVSPDEAYALTLYQVGALDAFARADHTRVRHVKAHGALYNMAARDLALAKAIASAVRDYDDSLLLYALAGSAMVAVAEAMGLGVVGEGFADRRYESDGSLVPRREDGAVIADPQLAAEQALSLIERGSVTTRNGSTLKLDAGTICVHGDRADAGEFARALRARLLAAQVEVRAPAAKTRP